MAVMSKLMEDVGRIADVEEHLGSADQPPFQAEDQMLGSTSNSTIIPAKYSGQLSLL